MRVQFAFPLTATDPQPPEKAKPRRRRVFALVTLGLGLLVGCALVELALRVLDKPQVVSSFEFLQADLEVGELFTATEGVFVRDREVLWKLDTKTSAYVANRLGLRGWLPVRPKAERDLRIVCVGDSCTFGFNVGYEQAYGVRLERMLQAALPGRCVESVLAGIVGHSTQQNIVLYRQEIEELAPDLTVLYCGTWNDHLPSVGETDAERYARRNALRLQQVLYRVLGLDRSGAATSEEVKAAFRRGEAPFGRRVPLGEFEQNLEALLEVARGAGSAVVVIVPPLPESTLQQKPAALDYRAAVRAFARRHELPLVDGPAVFDGYVKGAPGRRESELFSDWAHPTALGHRLLAEALFEIARDLTGRDELPVPAPAAQLRIDACSPSQVAALTAAEIEVKGAGFAAPDAFDRIWIGGRWIPDVEIVDDTTLRLRLPIVPVGVHPIELLTANGPVRSDATLEVTSMQPRPVDAKITGSDSAPRLDVSCRGPYRAFLGLWWSTKRRAQPCETQYGPFWLDDGTPPEEHRQGAIYRFDKLQLTRELGPFTRNGVWALSIPIPPEIVEQQPAAIYVQGLILDPADAALATVTEVVTVPWPR